MIIDLDEDLKKNYEIKVMRYGNQGLLYKQNMIMQPIEIILNQEHTLTSQTFLNLIGKEVWIYSYKT